MEQVRRTHVMSDWNDARLILSVIRCGSFSSAAQDLGLDQATVSRRIAALEAAAGRPLFNRRRSGAQPTTAGLVLTEVAHKVEQAAESFRRTLFSLSDSSVRTVSIAASEGIIAYYLAPALLRGSIGPLVCEPVNENGSMPSLSFVAEDRASEADISVLTLGPNETPNSRAALRVRHIGTMRFVPVASQKYFEKAGLPDKFDQVVDYDLMDHSRYKADAGLAPWNDLVASKPDGPILTVDTTSGFYMPLVSGCGVTLLPTYSHLYEPDLIVLDIPVPDMRIELWLASHEDSLREPAVRTVYDTVAHMFLNSPWFR
jgi:DNA-binding transcriptional LysR family regulator